MNYVYILILIQLIYNACFAINFLFPYFDFLDRQQNKIQINCEKIFYVYKDTGKIIFQTTEI